MSDITATQSHAQPSLQHLEYILLKDVPKHLPAPYQNVHKATIWRWISKGLGPNKAKLKTMKIGGRRCTTIEWLTDFFAERSDVKSTSPAQEFDQRAEAANDLLNDELGL